MKKILFICSATLLLASGCGTASPAGQQPSAHNTNAGQTNNPSPVSPAKPMSFGCSDILSLNDAQTITGDSSLTISPTSGWKSPISGKGSVLTCSYLNTMATIQINIGIGPFSGSAQDIATFNQGKAMNNGSDISGVGSMAYQGTAPGYGDPYFAAISSNGQYFINPHILISSPLVLGQPIQTDKQKEISIGLAVLKKIDVSLSNY